MSNFSLVVEMLYFSIAYNTQFSIVVVLTARRVVATCAKPVVPQYDSAPHIPQFPKHLTIDVLRTLNKIARP